MNQGSNPSTANDLRQALRASADLGGLQPAAFEELSESVSPVSTESDIGLVLDLPIQVIVELGRTRITIAELMSFKKGSVIELDINAGDPLDLVVNGCLIAQGEVVIVNNRYGIRLTDIVSPSERLRKSHR
jgi:flagellar motor switch protein FliN/FliY